MNGKMTGPVEYYTCMFGQYRADTLPPELMDRVRAGAIETIVVDTCHECGAKLDEPYTLTEYTKDAGEAMKELDAICEKRWIDGDEGD